MGHKSQNKQYVLYYFFEVSIDISYLELYTLADEYNLSNGEFSLF